MRCRVCGEELPDRAQFCFICGAATGADGEKDGGAAANGADGVAAPGGLEVAAGDAAGFEDALDAAETGSMVAADPEATVRAEAPEAAPAPHRLEEPLSPMAAGAIPMVPAAPPPRARWADARSVRTGTARSGRTSRAWNAGSAYEHPRREAAPAAQEVPHEDAGPADEGAAKKKAAGAGKRSGKGASKRSAKAAKAGKGAVLSSFSAGGARALLRRLSDTMASRAMAIVISLVVVAVAGCAVFALSTSWFGPFAPSGEEPPQVQPPSDGSIAPLGEEEEAPEETPAGEVAVRATVEAYSWDELSQLSALIADASTDAEALDIAVTYHLCNADGTLDGTQTKTVTLADGTEARFAVAGFRHDERSDGSGQAGITFIARDFVSEQQYDPSGDPPAWEDAPIRAWANETLMDELPEELASVVVPVEKRTNLPMDMGEGSRVTTEYLWLPSLAEIDGVSGSYSDPEGSAYQLFEDMGVRESLGDGYGTSSFLVIGNNYWWQRTPSKLDSSWVFTVDPTGSPLYSRNPAQTLGVIVGFCV